MDIVRSQIGRLNGIIDIDTEPGQGTTFTIRLPLTLAIIKGLLVKVSGRVLILPMYNIAEIVRIHPEEIQTIQGEQAIINHGRIVPFTTGCGTSCIIRVLSAVPKRSRLSLSGQSTKFLPLRWMKSWAIRKWSSKRSAPCSGP